MNIAQTERTDIANIEIVDAEFILKLVNCPAWLRYIGDRNIRDIGEAEQYLRTGFLKQYSENGYSYYVVRLKNDIPIGICGFLKKPHLENPDFGFAFLPAYVGQGYGYEAGLATLVYGVKQFDFHELDAETSASNVASIRLLEKLGFDYLGPLCHPENQDSRLYRWRR